MLLFTLEIIKYFTKIIVNEKKLNLMLKKKMFKLLFFLVALFVSEVYLKPADEKPMPVRVLINIFN